MSERITHFEEAGRRTALCTPFDLASVIAGWESLRSIMARRIPEQFQRDEWAYLIEFLGSSSLTSVFTRTFGRQCAATDGRLCAIARPRGPVALWLPNNVSLLGPLMLALVSLSGNPLRMKGGSRGEDLAGVFLDYLATHLPEGDLREWVTGRVQHEQFDRDDPRNAAMAAESTVQFMFGGDEAVASIRGLERPLDCVSFAFRDRQSEAWIELAAVDDSVLRSLIRVFAVYGQAGCTSPARVVIIDGVASDADALRERLASLWPGTIKQAPAMHVASANILARQWAEATGRQATLVEGHGAVVVSGNGDEASFKAPMALPIVVASREEAAAKLPKNIQTIGHALRDPGDPDWIALLASTNVKRFVPVASMHEFGPVWDGHEFWRQLFEVVEIEL